ncbi:hypothetical protein ACIGN6_21120 [Streptomyces sp. NPDC053792]|uniref:hypothetical protein n=1 Tax=Streptomyces sp. NPDC053792 TaxID=3365716 RepID=UPI0037D6BCE0
MSVSRTSMRLAAAALVTVIGLGATSALAEQAGPALAGAGWDVAPASSGDGAGWDVAPLTTDGAGWDTAPADSTTVVLADGPTDGAGWDVAPLTTDGAGWDTAPADSTTTDPSTDGAGWD